MNKDLFRALMTNVNNRPTCDLKSIMKALYDVSKGLNEDQLNEYAELLVSKGIAEYKYGHIYINGKHLAK